jgi:hypothetical protein
MPHHPLFTLLFILLLSLVSPLAAAGYPAALEREVPPLPQAQLDSAAEYGEGASAVLNVRGSVDQAAEYYRGQLAGKGWNTTADVTIGNARALEFSRDQSTITVSIMPTSAGTTVAVTLSR